MDTLKYIISALLLFALCILTAYFVLEINGQDVSSTAVLVGGFQDYLINGACSVFAYYVSVKDKGKSFKRLYRIFLWTVVSSAVLTVLYYKIKDGLYPKQSINNKDQTK